MTSMLPAKQSLKIENGDPSWYVKYKPSCINDIAIHARKLNDVKNTLIDMLSKKSSYKILLLTGPSGCSKSTLINLLSEELIPNFRPRTYNMIQRMGPGNTLQETSADFTVSFNNSDTTTSSMNSFELFLNSSSYLVGPNLKLVLVEDLPNVFYQETRKNFQSSLHKWLNDSSRELPPLVICLTECEIPRFLEDDGYNFSNFSIDHKFIAETVLGNDILQNSKLHRIKFNPINKTLLKKTLKLISLNEHDLLVKNKKSANSTNQIIESISSKCGDIRSAISNFQFWCENDNRSDTSHTSTKEEALSFFHAVGKIIYGSKETKSNDDIVEALMDKYLSIRDPILKLGIYENYHINSAVSVDLAAEITEALSVCESFSNVKQHTEYFLRATRYAFTSRGVGSSSVNSKVMKFPREYKQKRKLGEYMFKKNDFKKLNLVKYQQNYSNKNIDLYYGFYSPVIAKAKDFKNKSLKAYLELSNTVIENPFIDINDRTDYLERLGGVISGIEADANIDVVTKYKSFESKSDNFMNDVKNLIKKDFRGSADVDNVNDDFSIEDDSDTSYTPVVLNKNKTHEDSDEDESLLQLLSQYPSQKRIVVSNQNSQVDQCSDLDDSDLELLNNK